MLGEWIQNILVYVVITTVLRGLVSNKSFLEIFRFVSGLILILLFASPAFALLSLDGDWYDRLEENIFQVDKKQVEEELRVAEGSFARVLQRECEEQMEEQLREMTEESGQHLEEIEVSLEKEEDGDWSVSRISMTISEPIQEVMSRTGEGSRQSQDISRIIIEKIPEESNNEKDEQEQEKQVWEDGETRNLKKKICQKFNLSQEVVDVWKINGENY